jgi:DNA repair photolyase
MKVLMKERVSPTLHDFPYRGPRRKCTHQWIVNVTPAGAEQCIHSCLYCYARDAIYSVKGAQGIIVYKNLAEIIEGELDRLEICPPLSISNVTDPCQDVPEVRESVKGVVEVLSRWGVNYHVVTKGDPSFLQEVPAFPGNGTFFLSVTIEGPPEILELLSPAAPDLENRLRALRWARDRGLQCQVRLDPVILPLWQAVYGPDLIERARLLFADFARAGAVHVVSSTGRFNSSSLARLARLLPRVDGFEQALRKSYSYDRSRSASGYMLSAVARTDFHRMMRDIAAEAGMTYAVCQELDAEVADSPGLEHCERFHMPFSRKTGPSSFQPIPGCTSLCHITCKDLAEPPCGRPQLALPQPYNPSVLKRKPAQQALVPGLRSSDLNASAQGHPKNEDPAP